jgi:hypothetical protein
MSPSRLTPHRINFKLTTNIMLITALKASEDLKEHE